MTLVERQGMLDVYLDDDPADHDSTNDLVIHATSDALLELWRAIFEAVMGRDEQTPGVLQTRHGNGRRFDVIIYCMNEMPPPPEAV